MKPSASSAPMQSGASTAHAAPSVSSVLSKLSAYRHHSKAAHDECDTLLVKYKRAHGEYELMHAELIDAQQQHIALEAELERAQRDAEEVSRERSLLLAEAEELRAASTALASIGIRQMAIDAEVASFHHRAAQEKTAALRRRVASTQREHALAVSRHQVREQQVAADSQRLAAAAQHRTATIHAELNVLSQHALAAVASPARAQSPVPRPASATGGTSSPVNTPPAHIPITASTASGTYVTSLLPRRPESASAHVSPPRAAPLASTSVSLASTSVSLASPSPLAATSLARHAASSSSLSTSATSPVASPPALAIGRKRPTSAAPTLPPAPAWWADPSPKAHVSLASIIALTAPAPPSAATNTNKTPTTKSPAAAKPALLAAVRDNIAARAANAADARIAAQRHAQRVLKRQEQVGMERHQRLQQPLQQLGSPTSLTSLLSPWSPSQSPPPDSVTSPAPVSASLSPHRARPATAHALSPSFSSPSSALLARSASAAWLAAPAASPSSASALAPTSPVFAPHTHAERQALLWFSPNDFARRTNHPRENVRASRPSPSNARSLHASASTPSLVASSSPRRPLSPPPPSVRAPLSTRATVDSIRPPSPLKTSLRALPTIDVKNTTSPSSTVDMVHSTSVALTSQDDGASSPLPGSRVASPSRATSPLQRIASRAHMRSELFTAGGVFHSSSSPRSPPPTSGDDAHTSSSSLPFPHSLGASEVPALPPPPVFSSSPYVERIYAVGAARAAGLDKSIAEASELSWTQARAHAHALQQHEAECARYVQANDSADKAPSRPLSPQAVAREMRATRERRDADERRAAAEALQREEREEQERAAEAAADADAAEREFAAAVAAKAEKERRRREKLADEQRQQQQREQQEQQERDKARADADAAAAQLVREAVQIKKDEGGGCALM